ncbi:MAG: metal-sulfur cluster assembly factor [Longimicrobiales bacterium]
MILQGVRQPLQRLDIQETQALRGVYEPDEAESTNLKRAVLLPTEKDIRKALRRVKDPELNLDLMVLGLVYGVEIQDSHVVARISLTSPFCPAANQILEEAEAAILAVEGVESAEVELTFDPPWSPERIDPLIRASLGI